MQWASTVPGVGLDGRKLTDSGVPSPRLVLLPHRRFISVNILNGFFIGIVLGFE